MIMTLTEIDPYNFTGSRVVLALKEMRHGVGTSAAQFMHLRACGAYRVLGTKAKAMRASARHIFDEN